MKKSLLLVLSAVTALAAMAQEAPQVVKLDASNVAQYQQFNVKARFAAPTKGQVVSEKKLSNNASLRVVKQADGSYFKEIYRPMSANAITKLTSSKKAPEQKTASTTLFESFEGWDGENTNWIPTTWSKKVSADTLIKINANSTWHVDAPSMFDAAAPDGNYVCRINYAIQYDTAFNATTLPQDE